MREYQLLIFDWDGTLVDSIGRIVAALRRAAEACELPQLSEERLKGIIGLGMVEAIDCLYPGLRATPLVERFRTTYGEHYLALESQPSALFPGVAAALEAFRAQGYRLAVATGKSRSGLDKVLAGRGWLGYFDVTRCADETASKPDPRMLHEILAHCRVRPERALMVGDSLFDLQMARQAQVDSVAVGHGAQSLAVLQAEAPALAIGHFDELRAWLGSGGKDYSRGFGYER
ncbi:HAD-IA family hydrolase [Pseudomonas sp. N040]|uniref:HAD-IA family hydrolase n=1 Tax=Pseudomonas sp. N040 TaxID=2785325 RepID=UPI0018A2987B|nr:HAD-IA family hydrolase [Pseudomonas sp. N040]MBF7731345.1 HAD-IA family hydrolase [Pseudomonas sp. N040]MBW7014988.1 HAD-IA family hydrolase [Pseudomonas sp. N040]